MGWLDISIGSENKGSNKDPNRPDTTKYGKASTLTQTLAVWRTTHPRITFLGMLLFSAAVLYIAVPWGLLFMLPDALAVYGLYTGLAALIAWYGSTKRIQHSYDPDIDLIYQEDPAGTPSIKRWKYKAGKFMDEFEFTGGENSDPLIEFREDGTRVISVVDIDIENQEAEGFYHGSLSPAELKKRKKAIKATRKWIRDQSMITSKLRYEFNQMKSEGLKAAINSVVRELDELYYPDKLDESVEDVLPEELQDQETAGDILDDLVEETEKTTEQLQADLEARDNGEQ